MHGKIILLGTSHPIQCGSGNCSPESVQMFQAYVRECCHSYDIQLVAEEMSCHGLSFHGVTATIAQTLADELSLSYLAVDLDNHERANLAIDDYSLGLASIPPGAEASDRAVRDLLREKISNPLRECCWFARILAKDVWPTLFICGANHVKNMVTLMNSVGQDLVVVHDDYEP